MPLLVVAVVIKAGALVCINAWCICPYPLIQQNIGDAAARGELYDH